MAMPGKASPVAIVDTARATAMLAGPGLVLFIAISFYAGLGPLALTLGAVAIAVPVVVFAWWHLRALARVQADLEALGQQAPPPGEHAAKQPSLAALARTARELESRWSRRDAELAALAGANAAILEAMPDPVIVVDRERRIARANAAATALFGNNLPGRELLAVLRHPDILESAEHHFSGRPGLGSVDLPWAGPPERHFHVRLAPLPRAGLARPDDTAAVLLVLHDVTALRHAERMRADFVANVSHELRTPLSALLGFTETLRGPARDDEAARERFLGIMHEQAQRMTRLVRDLLSLSRIEQSEHTPPTERVDLGRVIGSVVDVLALQAKAKGAAVEVSLAAGLPEIAGDGDQLAQVFQNLLDNAIKYGRANGKVRVIGRAAAAAPQRVMRTAGAAAADGWVSIAIADDGDGIAPEHLPRLTERFYRVDAARSRQLGGTGLGLAIVKHILNRHRGGLMIDSEPGHGAVFTVWLPATASQTVTTTPQGIVTADESELSATADKRH